MFLHYILGRPTSELISQVFYAQLESPGKNDWTLQIIEDLKLVGLGHYTMESIKSSSKESFKKLVKEKCAELAFTDLMKEKAEKSKMKNLVYDKLTMQEYLTTDILNSQQKKLIYKIRTRMIETPDCYGRNEICQLCNLARDEMSHVID